VPGSLVGVLRAFDERRLPMTFPGPIAGRLEGSRSRTRVVPRLLALLQAPILDAELAAGIRASASPEHQVRADYLREGRVRRRIAAALNRAVEDASRPARQGTAEVPLSRVAIRRCHREIRALANSVVTTENPRTQGIAIASQLAFDGGGPLFFRPGTPHGIERLANTVQAAQNALRVSADLDEPER
jgi:hypothetical protein